MKTKAISKRIDNPISIEDLLIRGLTKEITEGVKNYLEKNHIKREEIEINVEILEDFDLYKMEIRTTINHKKEIEREIKTERMDYMEKGARIGKPRKYKE